VLAIWLITTVIQLALGSAAGIVAFSTISDGNLALQAVDKADPRPSDVYSPDPEQRLLTARDLGNIVLLTVILVVLVVGLALLAGLAVNSLVD
jgi:ABC-type sugar transport system permease subunit